MGNSALGLSVRTLRDSDRKKDGGLPRRRAVRGPLCRRSIAVRKVPRSWRPCRCSRARPRGSTGRAHPSREGASNRSGALVASGAPCTPRQRLRRADRICPTPRSIAGARCDLIFCAGRPPRPGGGRTRRQKIIQGRHHPPARVGANGLGFSSVPEERRRGRSTAAKMFADISRLIAGKRLAIANPIADPAGARRARSCCAR